MFIEWLTEITGWPVWIAARSAERCRVPDSSVAYRRIRDQLHVGAHDAAAVGGQHDGAVHLGQLAQPGRRVPDVEGEAAVADGLDVLVVAEHDQRAGTAAQDALEAVPESGARRQAGDGLTQGRTGHSVSFCGHRCA